MADRYGERNPETTMSVSGPVKQATIAVNNYADNVHALTTTLENIFDRLFGSAPKAVQSSRDPESKPRGELAELEASIERHSSEPCA